MPDGCRFHQTKGNVGGKAAFGRVSYANAADFRILLRNTIWKCPKIITRRARDPDYMLPPPAEDFIGCAPVVPEKLLIFCRHLRGGYREMARIRAEQDVHAILAHQTRHIFLSLADSACVVIADEAHRAPQLANTDAGLSIDVRLPEQNSVERLLTL